MNIGVIGVRGRLGTRLLELGCIPIHCDITLTGSIINGIANRNFDAIINCAGYTNVDGCETDPLRAYRVNSFAPKNIADNFHGKLVHLSTDYIFDGEKGSYNELDIPRPLGSYGHSKLWGEIGLKGYKNLLIVRTTVLYDGLKIKPNFVSTVYDKLKNKERVTLPELYSTPTHLLHLAKGILKAIELDIGGILNIVGDTYLSRFEMAREIAKKFNFDEKLIRKDTQWIETGAKRGKYLGLDTRLAKLLGIPIYPFEDWLDEFMKELEGI